MTLVVTGEARAAMRIAVDAMGGDRGPQEVVRGVLDYAPHSQATFLIVGDPSTIEPELKAARSRPKNIEIVPATQVIEMAESPADAVKKKPDSSVVVGVTLVKEGRANALVTIGSTGAAMAASLLILKRIKGIDRPAIATPLPSLGGPVVLLDGGATPDCDPNNLYEFAVMGVVYAQSVLGVRAPRVGLLSNGEEDTKGNKLVKQTHELFREATGNGTAPFNFIGNVEGRDIFRGNVDVAVCDGFVGNVVLKSAEGVAEMVLKLIKEELSRHAWMKPFVAPLLPALKRLRGRIDYAEYGGAPLLGVNGVTIIGHGRSNAYAVANACRAAERAVQHNIIEVIRDRVCVTPAPPPPL